MKLVPVTVWMPWAIFAILDAASGRIARALVFAAVGALCVTWIALRRTKSTISRDGETVTWRNWPERPQHMPVCDIAGLRSAKGINRLHCEMLVSRKNGKVRRRPVWAVDGSQAAVLAYALDLPGPIG